MHKRSNQVCAAKLETYKEVNGDSIRTICKHLNLCGIDVLQTSYPFTLYSKLCKYVYPIVAYLTILDVIAVIVIRAISLREFDKLIFAYLLLCLITLFLWHSIYKRKKSLKKILVMVQNVSKRHKLSGVPGNCVLRILLIINVLLNLVFSLTLTLLMNKSEDVETFCVAFSFTLWNGCGEPSVINSFFIFVQTTALGVLSPLFSNLVGILYCALCFRCSSLLSKYRKIIENIMSSGSYHLFQPQIVKTYLELTGVIEEIQNIFSLPSFLVFLVAFMQAFVLLARFLLHHSKEFSSLLRMMEHLCLHLPSCVLVVFIPSCAAQVYIEMKVNRTVFQRIHQRMNLDLNCKTSKENLSVLKTLEEISPVTFSACNMIDFTGSIALTSLGTLLTYGLLILNLNA